LAIQGGKVRRGMLVVLMVLNSACGSYAQRSIAEVKKKKPEVHPFSLQAQISFYETKTLAVLSND
jgi:hypothetical protein